MNDDTPGGKTGDRYAAGRAQSKVKPLDPSYDFVLNSYDAGVLLRFFFYYMSMETRGLLMREHPQIYNRVHGRPIVAVVRCEDGEFI